MQHETISQSGDSADSVETADDSSRGGVKTAYLTDETGTAEAGPVPTFLHEIARTMQATADRERERIAANINHSLSAHVETVRFRASTEADELRRLAEADVDHLNELSSAEVERVRRETESRIAARRADLERHLLQHDALVEREIARATEAVEAYQNELGRFVGRLASEQEPTEIARLASLLPEPPRVEEIASAAHAAAIAELSGPEVSSDTAWTTDRDVGLVGVMDAGADAQSTGPNAQTNELAQTAAVPSEDGEVADGPTALSTTDDIDIRLHAVLVVAVIIAIVLLLVITGTIHAASSSSPAQGT